MARRRKQLVDLIRDGTFIARKDELLLTGKQPLPWPRLERYRKRAAAVANLDELRDVALELEKALRRPDSQLELLGDLQQELLKLGPAGSWQQLERFFPRYFKHDKGPRAGKPFRLDPFQKRPLEEFWRRGKATRRHALGRRVYDVFLFGAPKGTGKTPIPAVLGTYATVANLDAPEVYVLSGSRDQADTCHGFAKENIERGRLAAWLEVGSLISCPSTDGTFEISSSDGDLLQGVDPSAGAVDEWWLFRHRKQREGYNALSKGLHKRGGESWLIATSTAGWTLDSQLGEMFVAATKHPKLELHDDGYLMTLRDEESGFLFWWYGAPEDADIEDPRTVRRANPAPWIDPLDILRELHRPGTDELDWRRLNLNQWTKVKLLWLPTGAWQRRAGDYRIPAGAEIHVFVDAAHSGDTCSVAWAWKAPNGKIVVDCRVWALHPEQPAHEHVDDFYDDDAVHVAERYIEQDLADRFLVQEVVGEPYYFGAELRRLARRFDVGEIFMRSHDMRQYVNEFYWEVTQGGTIGHDGENTVLAQHLAAIAARKDGDGSWRLSKMEAEHPIDGGVSVIGAAGRAARAAPRRRRRGHSF